MRRRVCKPRTTTEEAEGNRSGWWAGEAHIYSATQTAVRTVVAGVTMEAVLTQRVAISAQLRELIAPQAEAVGVQVHAVEVRDVMLPGELGKAFSEVLMAKQEGQAALDAPAMAFGNWRDYLRGRKEVSLKKYLYVFGRLLACRWIERQLGQVPMLFAQLVEGVLDEADVRGALHELVERKQAGEELAVAPPVEALTRFIEAELPRLEALNEPDDAAGEVEELNGFFRRYALVAA